MVEEVQNDYRRQSKHRVVVACCLGNAVGVYLRAYFTVLLAADSRGHDFIGR